MKKFALVLSLVGLVLIGFAALSTTKTQGAVAPSPTPPTGNEQGRPGATLENGFNVANIGPCTFQEFYKKAWNVLGEPVSGFDGVKQWFQYGQLVCLPDSPAGQQVALANLGYTELRSTGRLPQSNAALDPAVQDFLAISLERGGIDPAVYFGEPISPPLCDSSSGRCVQYTEKTRFEFQQGATSGEAVTRSPLGLWQSHPESRPEYVQAKLQASMHTQVRMPILLAGIASLAAGALLLLTGAAGLRASSGATI